MENNKYRNTNDIDDTEYRRMRKSEDSSYEYHEADAEETDKAIADDGYPEVVEHKGTQRITVSPIPLSSWTMVTAASPLIGQASKACWLRSKRVTWPW